MFCGLNKDAVKRVIEGECKGWHTGTFYTYEFSAISYSITCCNYNWLLQLGGVVYMQSTEGVSLLIQALTYHSNCSYAIESIKCSYEETQCDTVTRNT